MSVVFALLIFSIIVTIHELGHFIFARLNGVEVLEFSLGMGPRILKFQGKETLYSIKILPLGGSCRMLGEDDFSEDEELLKLSEEEKKERLKRSFNSKSPFAKFSIVFAGPLFNFILAFICALFVIGNTGVDRLKVADVIPDYPAGIAGVMKGDEVIKINGKKMNRFKDFLLYNMTNNVKEYNIEVKRLENGEFNTYKYNLIPKFNEEQGKNMVGISWDTSTSKLSNIFELIKYSLDEVIFNIKSTLAGLKALITGFIGFDQMSGPIGIVNFVGETIKETKDYGIKVQLLSVLSLIILLSSNLGVMNLLPIPALDGGRIVFYIFEIITGRKANKKIEAYVHIAGFIFLMFLMLFIIGSDVYKLLVK